MVIKEAVGIRRNVFTFENERMDDETLDENEFEESYYNDYATREEKAQALSSLEEPVNAGSGDAAYLLGKAWRDGLCAPPWDEEAEKWFRIAAERGNNVAQYALGKAYLQGYEVGQNMELAE